MNLTANDIIPYTMASLLLLVPALAGCETGRALNAQSEELRNETTVGVPLPPAARLIHVHAQQNKPTSPSPIKNPPWIKMVLDSKSLPTPPYT